MRKESKNFLYKLLETQSPSGFEQKIQSVVKKRVTQHADTVDVDVHGNLIACLNPKGAVRVMLAGHCDQIGMMVTHIDEQGYLSFNQIGGLDPSVIPGSRVQILTRKGIVPGIIGRKAVHLLSEAERGAKIELKSLWIDIGAKDKKEADKLVRVGDPAVYDPGVLDLGKNIISSPGLDDRVGVFVVMETLRLVSEAIGKKKNFPVALYAVSTVQEEIGLRGAKTAAYRIDPHAGIAVDVTHATDNPGGEAKRIGTVKLGGGPVIARGANINPILEDLLIGAGEKKKIPFQMQPAPSALANDANAIQINRSGVAAATIGIPNRYMHTQVEVVDLRDLEHAAELIAQTVLSITARTSFIPA